MRSLGEQATETSAIVREVKRHGVRDYVNIANAHAFVWFDSFAIIMEPEEVVSHVKTSTKYDINTNFRLDPNISYSDAFTRMLLNLLMISKWGPKHSIVVLRKLVNLSTMVIWRPLVESLVTELGPY